MQLARTIVYFFKSSMSRFVAMAIVAAALAGCAAPKEKITWNTPRQVTTAEPPAAAPSETTTDGELRDKALQDAMNKTEGGPCREFQETVMIDGKAQRAYGTACRQPDGTWKRVSTSDKPTTEAPVSSFPYQGYSSDYPAYPRYYPRYHFGFGYGHRRSHFGYGVHW